LITFSVLDCGGNNGPHLNRWRIAISRDATFDIKGCNNDIDGPSNGGPDE